jgi:cobaltochelatase CobN
MKKKYIFLIILAAIVVVAFAAFWRSMCSATRVAFVNYQVITLGQISKANDNPSFITLADESLDNIDRWKDYDVVLINGMGLRPTEEQRARIQALADGGLPILTTAATNPANAIVSLDEWDADSLKQYLSAGGRANYRNLLNYLRNEIDGKLFFTREVEPVQPSRAQLMYHPDVQRPGNEDVTFATIGQNQQYLTDNGLFMADAPRILITGMMGDATQLIGALEKSGDVVYATTNLARLVRTGALDSIAPSAIINMAHGRIGDYVVDELRRRNIPLFGTVNVNRMTADWEADRQGMQGGFLAQSIIVPEVDGMIRPTVLFAIREGDDGLPEAYTMPERLEGFVANVNRHIALQRKPNAEKRVAVVYFKGPGSAALTASGMEVVPSLHNFLMSLKAAGYNVAGLPATADGLAQLIQRQGSTFGTYAEGAQAEFMANGNPQPVGRDEFEAWTRASFTDRMLRELQQTNGRFPGDFFALDDDHLGLPVVQLGNIVLMPQMPAGTGSDSFKMVHGTSAAPPYPYIAQYLWAQRGFEADALIHFGTHGSLEYTPGKQVALSQDCWSDRLVGTLPHFYFYTIGNVGEGMIAKRRTYASLTSYLTPPFMESRLRDTYRRLSEAIEAYDRQPDERGALAIKRLTVQMGIHRELRLDSVLSQPYSADEIARIEAFAEELCNGKVTGMSYTLGVPYEAERIRTSVYAMATDPIAYSLCALDKQRGRVAADVEKHAAQFTARYLTPARSLVTTLLNRTTDVTDAEICRIAGITADDLRRAHHVDSVQKSPQQMMSMMMSMAGEMPGARKSVPVGHKDSAATASDTTATASAITPEQRNKMREMGKGMDPKKALAVAKMMGASPEQLKKMKAAMMGKGGDGAAASDNASAHKMANIPPAMQRIVDKVAEAAMLTPEDKELARVVLEVERTVRNVAAYREALATSPATELRSMLNALDGGYTAPSPGGDVISNPQAVPTGRNLYGVNSETCPTELAWERGKELAEGTINLYRQRHNDSIPRKVSYTLWSSEFIETGGATIAQCLYMLGVEPIRDAFGRVTDIRLIPSEELGRPRIDVVVQTSGQLRDLAASRLFLLSRAVEMAASANDDKFPNLVADGVREAERILIEKGLSPKEARETSTYRVFGGMNGNYGTGIQGMTMASDRWDDESQLAEVYLNNMGAFYGKEGSWEEMRQFAFEAALANTDAVIQPRQSNTWGALSLDHVYEFMGGMNMAVRNVTGKDPDAYLSDYRNRNRMRMQEVKEAIGVESRTTLFNPAYIAEKMKGGASDASGLAELVENTFGWNVMKPDVIDNEMWDEIYDVYVADKFQLSTRRFFEAKNPAALQEMTAVMMESARKGYWKASDEMLANVARLHTELVAQFGANGSQRVCDNTKLRDFIASKVSSADAQQYRDQISRTRDAQVATADGKVLKRESTSLAADEETTSVSNLVVVGIVVAFVVIVALLVKRRRSK